MRKRILACLLMLVMVFSIALPIVTTITTQTVQAAPTDSIGHHHSYTKKHTIIRPATEIYKDKSTPYPKGYTKFKFVYTYCPTDMAVKCVDVYGYNAKTGWDYLFRNSMGGHKAFWV